MMTKDKPCILFFFTMVAVYLQQDPIDLTAAGRGTIKKRKEEKKKNNEYKKLKCGINVSEKCIDTQCREKTMKP